MDLIKRRVLPLSLVALMAMPAGCGVARAGEESDVVAPDEEVETEDLPDWSQQELNQAEAAEKAQDDARDIGTWDDAERAANEGTPTWGNRAVPPPAAPSGTTQEAVPESDRDRGRVGFNDFYNQL